MTVEAAIQVAIQVAIPITIQVAILTVILTIVLIIIEEEVISVEEISEDDPLNFKKAFKF